MRFGEKGKSTIADQSRMASTMLQKERVFQCLVIMNCISYSSCFLILFPYALNLLMQYNCLSEITVANWFPVARSKDIFVLVKYSLPLIQPAHPQSFKKSSFVPKLLQIMCMWIWFASVPAALCVAFWKGLCMVCAWEWFIVIFKRSEDDLKNPYGWGRLWKVSFLV